MFNSFLDYFTTNFAYICGLFYNHIQYTMIAVVVAIFIGVPLGIIIFNFKHLDKPVLSFANLIQAIPSLAILGFIVPYFGIGASTAIFMVVLYSLMPILKNTYTGLSSINPDTLEAAKGIGMTRWQILSKVQIPLALPVIMAGIRISTVTAVGLMTIAAYIGADVLGSLVISGIQTDNSAMILAGAIPACVLALTMDFLMNKVEKAVTPVSLQLTAANLSQSAIDNLKRARKQTLASGGLIFAIIIGMFGFSYFSQDADIVIGSKEATEGRIIGNMIAEAIEQKTDLTVERTMGLGGTMIAYEALNSGEIDIYPDYTGTLLSTVLGETYQTGDTSEEVYDYVSAQLEADGIYTYDAFDINNTYCLAVSAELAEQYDLETFSDLAKISSRLDLGSTPEFAVREDGLLGIQDTYNMYFNNVYNFSGTLMYTAIDSDEVDVIVAFATDSLIEKYGLVVLEDDLNFFPPYNLVAVANEYVYYTYPEVATIIDEVIALLDDEIMRTLNGYVTDDGKDSAVVAKEFLQEVGYID
ncbi:glycine betaine ABC transporter substrate-binding protein [Tannockella kyphosi]|uniref:glycine betaine ABC transporter substrate-binding protein n=1 Tax=Tannockella kyphosi TaxID=2899121 RepID=UPI00201212F9|nr:glycine betaine ABC transporter substrate-binding protein [Tannockella kyphosi]